MIILAIDSTMIGCSACLYNKNQGVIASKVLEISRGQAECLMPMIDELVKNNLENYNDINLIAVTKGPGAFTGMRIGLATAKALGLALDVPVIGVSTFDAVLATYLSMDEHKTSDYYGILIETKRSDYYFQLYFGDKVCCDGAAMESADILSMIGDKSCIILGDAMQRFQADTSVNKAISFYNIKSPIPSEIAQLAMLENGRKTDCLPLYLRMPEIGSPKNQPRKLK